MSEAPSTPQEQRAAEELNAAIDAMRQKKSQAQMTPSAVEIDAQFQQRLETELVRRFGNDESRARWKTWALFTVPTASLALLVVGIIAAVKPELFTGQRRSDNELIARDTATDGTVNTNTTTTTNANSNTSSNAEQQNTEETVQELFPEIDAELASIEPELTDFTEIKNDIESTMEELEALLENLEALESMSSDSTDVDQQLEELSSTPI